MLFQAILDGDWYTPVISIADIGKFLGCIFALCVAGGIQWFAAMYFGFTKKFQVIYAVEFVGLVALVLWKVDYTYFKIGAPIMLALGTWQAYRMVGSEAEQTVERHFPVLSDEPVAVRPPSGPVITDDQPGVYGADGRVAELRFMRSGREQARA